jgi:hypothetical protein
MRHCLMTLSSLYAGMTMETSGLGASEGVSSSGDLSADIQINLTPAFPPPRELPVTCG